VDSQTRVYSGYIRPETGSLPQSWEGCYLIIAIIN